MNRRVRAMRWSAMRWSAMRGSAMRWSAVLSVTLVACGGWSAAENATGTPLPVVPVVPVVPVASGPVGPVVVGQTYQDPRGWIEYQPGDAPVIIVAPHGGTLTPLELPDRSCAGCVTTNDLSTQELARAVIDSFVQRTGKRPHLVVNRLHRRKFDGNRDQAEATGGAATLSTSWTWLQAAFDTATQRVATRSSRGILLDLHGHAHALQRLELGYLLTDTELRRSDATLTALNDMSRTSIARLAGDARGGERGVQLLRGPNSLGALLAAAGYASVPSPVMPAPLVGEDYFDGGFNTRRNGSVLGGAVDAIQIESHFTGVRDTADSRARFAGALVTALLSYLDRQYGWRP